ncbi:S-adenosyl methyltransferase [Sinosporangium album]|uniref:S-adenosyl methyltransferase n=1 Tax=Sinosporangium album TaxID=504805 RepID=A0A1G8DKH9_9ACTN|nr:SAM-dependent methyltransferase [Sinosporangium album]SDH58091.1 S-adenosyl methyltransferase [Sinosporangium album]
MAQSSPAPGHDSPRVPEIDTSVPHSARIWNYWLGGKDNYPVDREAGDAYTAVFPGIVDIARHSRAFLARTIRHLAGEAGVRQFLDVGTGLPTVDNTHEIAQRVAPESRIVYVDNDPLVLVHARALLTSSAEGVTSYIDADLHDPAAILERATETLDLRRPVALILSGVTGHIGDYRQARSIVSALLSGLPSGSYLSLNDGLAAPAAPAAEDTGGGDAYEEAQDNYNESGAIPYVLRDHDEIAGFFDGLELLAPGVVSVPLWRPDPAPHAPEPIGQVGGVGRKP